MFEERRTLVNKWFDKWTDAQRRKVLEDLIARSSRSQGEFAVQAVRSRQPERRLDFTRELPRAISLYIFSFLDPRSLCRSAQVCWYWKFLAESDEVWMPKAARLGWILTQDDVRDTVPDPLCASNLWKRFYLGKIRELQVQRPNKDALSAEDRLKQEANGDVTDRHPAHTRRVRKPAPWRGPDPKPMETWRKNYLDEDDEEKMRKGKPGVKSASRSRSGRKHSAGKFTAATLPNEPRPLFDEEPLPAASKRAPSSPSPPRELLPASSYPRPGPTQKLLLRRRSPDRTERDLPSRDLFPAASSVQAISPPVPPAS